MNIKSVPIDSLCLDPSNVRKHNEKNLQAICASLKRFGQQKPIVVDKNNLVRAGNGTLQAAQAIGWKKIDVVYSELESAEMIAYAIADNRTAELADWDMSGLKEQLGGLDEDLREVAYEDFPLEELATEPDEKDDDVPDTDNNEFDVKLGDLWILGEHRLVCGDSTDILQVERLMDGQKADVVFTDPPYGYKYQSNYQKKHKMLENDDKIIDFLPVAYSAMENNSCIYVCGSHQTIDIWKPLFQRNFTYKNLIVWKKNNWSMGDLKGAFAGQHELIMFGHKGKIELEGKRETDVWEFDREPPKDHPTQKPVDLISFAISKSLSNRILDLFLGSGSTLMACEKTKRKCYGMEIEPHYCSVIIKRWQQFTGLEAIRG